jgi:hypothetical protein
VTFFTIGRKLTPAFPKSGRRPAEESIAMKLNYAFVSLAITLMQMTAVNAQSVLPTGHYTKKSGGAGEMRIEKAEDGWRVFVTAGGIPRGGATAADCTLIAVGGMSGNVFQGEIKYNLDPDTKPSPDNAVESGHKMTITFAGQVATITAADVGNICGNGTGLFGRYTKDRR